MPEKINSCICLEGTIVITAVFGGIGGHHSPWFHTFDDTKHHADN